MKKDSIILITGQTGMVGRNLFEELKRQGYTNLIKYPRTINLLLQEDTEFLFGSIPEYVFHCAAKVGGIAANVNNPYDFLYQNLQIQNNVINACIKFNVKKVVNVLSSCMYPKDYKQPLKEEYILKSELEHTNIGYALAKICSQKLCEYANKKFETKFICLSPCNLYGKYEKIDLKNSHVLTSLVKKIVDAKNNGKMDVEIWGDGSPRREFLYVSDFVDCMIWSMHNLEKTETFLNVGTGKDISIEELAELIAKITNWSGIFHYDLKKDNGMMVKRNDVSKINNLGWKAKTSLEEGIKKTIQYYKEIKNV